MRILIQRVTQASVIIEGKIFSKIKAGMLIFIGIEEADNEEDISWLTNKIANLRIFDDANGVPNLSAKDSKGEYLVVSQFTLHASVKKGNRPSFIKAARPEIALALYHQFLDKLKAETNTEIQTGSFGAMMQIELVNDGPFTIWIDSKMRG
ncbi:MAG: D-tyrosyl-tRNA(Tyr) deacylase [Bacteroidetes bacterium]|nr:D-tyrosyl-tRNA(Tyr) deacylase [Bacteroidota bacterium]